MPSEHEAGGQMQPVGDYSFDEYRAKAAEFHGYPAPGIMLAGYMVELGKSHIPEGTLFEVVVETSKCLPDAVQLLTLCTFGNCRIRLSNTGRYALALYDKYTGEGVRVFVDSEKLKQWPELHAWLMKEKPKAEQDSDLLMREIGLAGDSVCSVEPVKILDRYLGKAPSGKVGVCLGCNEPYFVADGPLCRGCLGETPYRGTHPSSIDCDLETMTPLTAVPVEEAVGREAVHDMTRIVPGESKGVEFEAGQKITAGDVCRLQQMGRSRLFVHGLESSPDGFVHENDAALAFAERLAGEGVGYDTPPKEGKIDFYATADGLLTMDTAKLKAFNMVPNVTCAARQNNIVVEQGRKLAGTRAIPLYLTQTNFAKALAVLGEEPLFAITPVQQLKVGILVTGTEVFQGLVQDRFIPIISKKVERFGCPVVGTAIVPDDRAVIAGATQKLLAAGAELIVTTAGLSVDPDDVTRLGLLDAGLNDMLYGAPLLPGAMTLLGRMGEARVMGVPACALFYKTTSFDILLPRVLAGQELTRADLAAMAEGGFCLNCSSCTFPKCPFGK